MDAALVLLAMFLLVLLEGFFSGSEIAIVHCDRAHLREKARRGHAGAALALRLLRRPEVILATTLVGTNIAVVTTTALGTTLLIGLVGDGGDLLAVLLFAPIILVFGEVVPKSVYQQQSDALTPRIIYPLYVFSLLFFPIVFVFSRTARLAARVIGGRGPGAELFAVREQLRAMLETAEDAASVDIFDRERIRNVVRFGELSVGDVMIPAAEMIAVDSSYRTEDAMALTRRTGHTRLPVYEGRRSNVTGMISLDLWHLLDPELASRELRDLVRPALFVPAQQALVELLPTLRAREDQSAIVVDEYGSAIGLITVDDILESVVGRIEVGREFEERDTVRRPGYETLDDGGFLLDARLPISVVNEALATRLGTAEAHTIGGLLVARLRHIPRPGEYVETDGFRFRAEAATDRAVTRVRAERSD